MARDYRAMEVEFIDDLKSRSGRSLAEWMTAIDAQGLSDRDEIIDWLHPQGFTFEHASWLERIHNNGGRAIYGDEPGERAASAPPPRREAQPISPQPAPPWGAPPVRPPTVAPATAQVIATPLADPDELAALLAKGKAYRMLADFVIAEARRALPDLQTAVQGDLVAFCRPLTLAVMAVTPRELRLGLALGTQPVIPPLMKPKGLGVDPAITHMLLLNDARQIDETLIAWLRLADSTVNSTAGDH